MNSYVVALALYHYVITDELWYVKDGNLYILADPLKRNDPECGGPTRR